MEPSSRPKRTILKQATQPENRMAIETAVESPITTTSFAGPNPGDVIVTENLWKTYEMGDQRSTLCAASTSASGTTSTSPSWAPPAPENQR